MRRTGILLAIMIVLSGASTVVHADSIYDPNGQYRTTYTPAYNSNPQTYISGCSNGTCTVAVRGTQYPAHYSTQYPTYTNVGAQKGIAYVQPSRPDVTNTTNYTSTIYPTTYSTVYPGIPDTGAGGEAGYYFSMLILSVLCAIGAGIYLLRARAHG